MRHRHIVIDTFAMTSTLRRENGKRKAGFILRTPLYADPSAFTQTRARVMWFILLRRSPRVFSQTNAIAVCVPFQGDGFILYPA